MCATQMDKSVVLQCLQQASKSHARVTLSFFPWEMNDRAQVSGIVRSVDVSTGNVVLDIDSLVGDLFSLAEISNVSVSR